jgi:hypothetical protein
LAIHPPSSAATDTKLRPHGGEAFHRSRSRCDECSGPTAPPLRADPTTARSVHSLCETAPATANRGGPARAYRQVVNILLARTCYAPIYARGTDERESCDPDVDRGVQGGAVDVRATICIRFWRAGSTLAFSLLRACCTWGSSLRPFRPREMLRRDRSSQSAMSAS